MTDEDCIKGRIHPGFADRYEMLRRFVLRDFGTRDMGTWNAMLIAAALLTLSDNLSSLSSSVECGLDSISKEQ